MNETKKDYRDARRLLDGIAKAGEELKAELRKRCDWTDPLDVREYRTSVRRKARRELLDRNVPLRICDGCGKLWPSSRSWVVVDAEDGMVRCRSCYFKGLVAVGSRMLCDVSIFREERRFALDPGSLVQAREQCENMSCREFAARAGWSRSYQTKLEAGGVVTVSLTTRDTIVQVLAEAGAVTKDGGILETESPT